MSIPLLEYKPSSQNQRVATFEVGGDEQPRIYSTEKMLGTRQLPADEIELLIRAAYRQVFHEQQMIQRNRQSLLESQLKSGQITVQDFIRGLATSESFRRLNYDVNNNYRFVELCVQRLLGRRVYNDREKYAWSIVLATRGLNSFVEELLSSEEYRHAFGTHTVPYQRRRVVSQPDKSELPFERMARYGTDYRDRLPLPSSVGRSSGHADGLFGQFEPFDFKTFVQRANWSMVSGVTLVVLLLIVASLAIAGSAVREWQ
jgi:phycobilisome rod-core linker protein